MLDKLEEIQQLSSGEFKYSLYDAKNKEHKNMFKELYKDEEFLEYLDGTKLRKIAKLYKKYVTDEKNKYVKVPTLVVERNDKALGVLQLHIFEEINSITLISAVRPKYRNMGIKKCMILDICEYLFQNNIEYVEFDVSRENKVNIKALEDIGCTIIRTRKYDSEVENDLVKYKLYPSHIMYQKKG